MQSDRPSGATTGCDSCPFCGEQSEVGFLSWNSYPIHWTPGEDYIKLFSRHRGRRVPLIRPKRWGFLARAQAYRCTSCRKVWADY